MENKGFVRGHAEDDWRGEEGKEVESQNKDTKSYKKKGEVRDKWNERDKS